MTDLEKWNERKAYLERTLNLKKETLAIATKEYDEVNERLMEHLTRKPK